MLCTIWYYLYKWKIVKNTHGGVLISVKLQAWSLQLYQNQHSSMGVFHVFCFVQKVPNRATHHIFWIYYYASGSMVIYSKFTLQDHTFGGEVSFKTNNWLYCSSRIIHISVRRSYTSSILNGRLKKNKQSVKYS